MEPIQTRQPKALVGGEEFDGCTENAEQRGLLPASNFGGMRDQIDA
jgi:hypothetical protein